MDILMKFKKIDILVFIIANIINFIMIGIFISRKFGLSKIEFGLGIFILSLFIPLSIIVYFNITNHRESWSYSLIIPILVFLIIELIFDYILKLDFRNISYLLYPYIFVYYLGLLGMIGYSFGIGKIYGFITLSTYFMNLFATWFVKQG